MKSNPAPVAWLLVLLMSAGGALAAQSEIVNIEALDSAPARIAYAVPRPPEALVAAGGRADVSLALVVDEEGRVSRVENVQAPTPELAAAAEAAVRAWMFEKGFVAARPVSFRVPVTLAFRPGQAVARGDPATARAGVAQVIEEAAPEYQVAPVYPPELRDHARDGHAMVTVFVDAVGTPSDAVVELASHPAFVAPAIAAVQKWTFAPARVDGKLVATRTQVTVRFRATDAQLTAADQERQAQLSGLRSYDVAPEPITQVPLIYPYDALLAGGRGTAALTIVVSPEGQIALTRVERASAPEFGHAARACVSAWTFEPATKVGNPVFAEITWEIVFNDGANELQFDEVAHELLTALRAGTLQLTSARELDAPLKPRERVEPRLPPEVDRATATGDVVVQVIIDRNGRTQLPKIVSAPSPELGYAAATAAARWRFEPPRKGGQPVDVRVAIPFRFTAKPPAPVPTEATP